MPLGADRPVVLLLLITFTHYLNECTPYHMLRRKRFKATTGTFTYGSELFDYKSED